MGHVVDGAANMTAPGQPNSLVETKVAAGSGTGIAVGLLTWALVTFIPAWHDGIPSQLVPFIPVAAAWLVSTAAGYLAPHTHRPDLLPVAEVVPVPVAVPVAEVTAPPRPAEVDAGLAIVASEPLPAVEERLAGPGLPPPPTQG